MKSNKIKSLISVMFFLGAIMVLGCTAGWWDLSFSIDGIWAFVLIIPAAFWVFLFGANILNSLIFFAGLGFLIYERGIVPSENIVELCVSMALMAISLTILGSNLDKVKQIKEKKAVANDQDTIDASYFGSNKRITNVSENVKGGKLSSKCSHIIYDLSNAKIENGAQIDIESSCGNTEIILPAGFKYIINSSSSFGKVINDLEQTPIGKTITLVVKNSFGTVTFCNKDKK